VPEKPQCCKTEMDWLMDNKVREAFQCQHCGQLVVQDKRTGEETWYTRIFNPNAVMKERR